MTRVLRDFSLVFLCLLLISVGACSREDREKREINKIFKNAIKEKQRPEMKKENIVEVFHKNKPLFIELKDRMLKNSKATQIAFGNPPGAHLINFKWIGKEKFSYEYVQQEFGIEGGWLKGMFDEMEKLGCGAIEKSYVDEDINPLLEYRPPRHEVLEFELEAGGFFGPDWTKGIAYYPYDYMPKTRENGFGGQWVFYQYFNKVEDNWYVFSRR